MKTILLLIRRAIAWSRMVFADINVEAVQCGLRDTPTPGDRMYLLRRLVEERARRAMARADYQSTLPVGERQTWIDA